MTGSTGTHTATMSKRPDSTNRETKSLASSTSPEPKMSLLEIKQSIQKEDLSRKTSESSSGNGKIHTQTDPLLNSINDENGESITSL